jgi:hypothetical protein
MKMTTKRLRLRRVGASKFLLEKAGLQVSPRTLANKASYGTGPAYVIAGIYAEYDPDDLLAWAASQITPKAARASELREPVAA